MIVSSFESFSQPILLYELVRDTSFVTLVARIS